MCVSICGFCYLQLSMIVYNSINTTRVLLHPFIYEFIYLFLLNALFRLILVLDTDLLQPLAKIMQSSHLQDVQQLCNLKEIPEQISICKIFNHVQAITSWLLLVDMQKIFIEQKLALETGELVFFCVCVFFRGCIFFLEIISLIMFVH